MASTPDPVDRRAALKAKSRRAILDAAAGLMQRRRGTDFSVDELAAAADVSRRTVFNHFASLEDVATEVAGEMLNEIVDRMQAQAASAPPDTVLADLVATAAADQLVPVVAELVGLLGVGSSESDHREAVLMQRAFTLFTERMSAAMTRRHPAVDALAVELLVAAFCGGVLAFVRTWMAETGAVDTPESRRAWDDYTARLTAVLREPA
ncbi:TetR/AcrR family transcriptional regulator [Glycomyces sp. TRM65418]|uniref:TetR/AcrR family transcriptional regulator n=1 Tax=Glycomyces sp. TRM65418 TaxID=2867006 RepID=UPI001CE52FB1|nr:TetR/AcrR family transcriptional regulator [Glycomyces sp. TRM65418]MCC3765638.1 TetR/AcrR family transcriptional regulator [Glycomyces sp. TRM65418]QZD55236.1 TetR/AcrR family transcriptional regulator [Glycomyces sp. TRM65418]